MKPPKRPILAIVAMLSMVGASAAAQVGIRVPGWPLRDSVSMSPLFKPSAKTTLSPRTWTAPPPDARLADLPRNQVGTMTCPMPVFVPDSTKQDRMPIGRLESALVERMPVATGGCTNPLWNKTRP